MNKIKALLTFMETGIISPAKAIKEIKKEVIPNVNKNHGVQRITYKP